MDLYELLEELFRTIRKDFQTLRNYPDGIVRNVTRIFNQLGWESNKNNFEYPNAPDLVNFFLIKNQKKVVFVKVKMIYHANSQRDQFVSEVQREMKEYSLKLGVLVLADEWVIISEGFPNNIGFKYDQNTTADMETVMREGGQMLNRHLSFNNVGNDTAVLENAWENFCSTPEAQIKILADYLKKQIPVSISNEEVRDFVKQKLSQPANNLQNIPTQNANSPAQTPRLTVVFRDGTRFRRNQASDTFVEVVQKIGIQRVLKLDITSSGRNDLIIRSNTRPAEHYNLLGDNYYLHTNTQTKRKLALINMISNALDLGLDVKIE